MKGGWRFEHVAVPVWMAEAGASGVAAAIYNALKRRAAIGSMIGHAGTGGRLSRPFLQDRAGRRNERRPAQRESHPLQDSEAADPALVLRVPEKRLLEEQ